MEEDKPDNKTLIKPAEAAARFHVPVGTIYTWHQLGKIDGIKLNGRSLRIFTKSLCAFLESRKKKTGEQAPHRRTGRRLRAR